MYCTYIQLHHVGCWLYAFSIYWIIVGNTPYVITYVPYLGPDHLYIINIIELIKITKLFKIFGPWLGTDTTHEIYWLSFEKSWDNAYQ